MKFDLQKDFELFRRRFGLVDADAERTRKIVERLKTTASSYHAELKRLETGNFSPTKVAEIEKLCETLGGEVPRDSSYLESWYRFCQQGYCMSDMAKRRKTLANRKSLWLEEGRLLGDQFEILLELLVLEQSRIRESELGSDGATA